MWTRSLLRLQAVGLVFGVCLTLASTPAWAEKDNCTHITNMPTTISTAGVYCLKSHIGGSTGGFAFMGLWVAANNVVIDFNGFSLRNVNGQDPGNFSVGVLVGGPDVSNVTIRNGTIDNFAIGIAIWGQGGGVAEVPGLAIEQMHLTRIGGTGIFGMVSESSSGLIRDCDIEFVGPGTHLGPHDTAGILFNGGQMTFLNNDVHGVVADAGNTAVGFNLAGPGHIVLNNRVGEAAIGFLLAQGVFRNNIVVGAAVPYSGGNNLGNNQ